MKRAILFPRAVILAAIGLLSLLASPAAAESINSALARQRGRIGQLQRHLDGLRRQDHGLARQEQAIRNAISNLCRMKARYYRAGKGRLWQHELAKLNRGLRSVASARMRIRGEYGRAANLLRGAHGEYQRLRAIQHQRVVAQREAQRRAAVAAERRRQELQRQRAIQAQQAEARRRAVAAAKRRRIARTLAAQKALMDAIEQSRVATGRHAHSHGKGGTAPSGRQPSGMDPRPGGSASAPVRNPGASGRTTPSGRGNLDAELRQAIAQLREVIRLNTQSALAHEGPEPRFAPRGTLWHAVKFARDQLAVLEARLARDSRKASEVLKKRHKEYTIAGHGRRFKAETYVKVRKHERTNRDTDDGLIEYRVTLQHFYCDTNQPASRVETRMEYVKRPVVPGEALASSVLSETPKAYRFGGTGEFYMDGGEPLPRSHCRVEG
ncbi:MAG: hypothetical protein ACYTEZ_11675 [Planctomycetota bacterium]|jgi:hypothetical protein